MYKVMLIDDDVPVLKYLKDLIPWTEMNLEICASTFSSVKAIELFKQHMPDLVITDIGIPQIDGIELASMFRKLHPDVRIIFLTCHEDFHYARRALQLNADEYLIKDELSAEKLEQAVQKAMEKIIAISKYVETDSIRNTVERNKTLLKQAFTERLSRMSASEMIGRAKELGIHWSDEDFMLAMTAINYASFPQHYRLADTAILKYAVLNIAEELCSNQRSIIPLVDEDFNVLLVYNFNDHLKLKPARILRDFMELLHEKVKKYLNFEISYYFTKGRFKISSLGQTLQWLKKQRKYFFYGPAEHYYSVENHQEQAWNVAGAELLSSLEEEWTQAWKEAIQGNSDSVKIFLSKLKVTTEKWHVDPKEFNEVLLRWLQNSLDLSNEKMTRIGGCLLETFNLSHSLTLIDQFCATVLVREQAEPKASTADHTKPKVQEIEQYIMEHLSENISSVTMANYLHLNPSYFSRYFRRISGETFTDYVHSLKMRIASKMLLETDHTVEFISYRLGYSDRTYFSKIFKKYTGVSPSEYKSAN